MTELQYRGGVYHLHFSGALLFDFYDRYGNDKNVLDVIEPQDKAGFEATVWLLCELSKHGELYRRYIGLNAGQVLNYERALASITPGEYGEIKSAVIEAVYRGFARQHPGEGDDDPWLQEYEAEHNPKKAQAGRSGLSRLLAGLASLLKRG